jgi:hypothetical protein
VLSCWWMQLRLPKLGVAVMSVVRGRFMLVDSGNYLCAVFSFAPLPSKSLSEPAGKLRYTSV